MTANQVSLTLMLAALMPVLGATDAMGSRGMRAALELQPESRLWVAGTSTVRSFQCQATAFEAKVVASAGAAAAVLGGEKAVSSVELTVPVEKLDCRNGTMNEHMRKALKAKNNPTITFRLTSYELAKTADAVAVTMQGTLTLGGTEKPVTIAAQGKAGEDGRLLVSGTHEVRMTEFGLKPPTLMLGTMKVDERIKVGFEIVLKD
jgi:polyisoprenoid-binding protein YceI